MKRLPTPNTVSPDTVKAMTLDLLLDSLGTRLNGPKAANKTITLNLRFSDTQEMCVLVLANGALNHTLGEQRADTDATLTLSRFTLNKIIMGESSLKREIDTGEANVHGKKEAFHEMFSLLDTFEFWFNIITPLPDIYFLFLALMTITYLLLVESVKRRLMRSPQGT